MPCDFLSAIDALHSIFPTQSLATVYNIDLPRIGLKVTTTVKPENFLHDGRVTWAVSTIPTFTVYSSARLPTIVSTIFDQQLRGLRNKHEMRNTSKRIRIILLKKMLGRRS
jgi:hypothetical protein